MHLEAIYYAIKVIGVLLVIAGCSGMGLIKARTIDQRLSALKELKRLFMQLKAEIRCMATPLPEAIHRLASGAHAPFALFLKNLYENLYTLEPATFAQLWTDHVEQYLKQSALTAADLHMIKEMGQSLGTLDLQMQLGTLDLYMERLDQSIIDLSNGMAAQKKLYSCMGIMGGIFIVILLI